MNKFIKKIPIPVAGIALAFLSFGNLISEYSVTFKNICTLISVVLLILLTVKIIIFKKDIMKDLNNPLIAGVAANYPMGIMLLSVELEKLNFLLGITFFAIGILIHFGIWAYFTQKYICKFHIKNIFPTALVVYVGIGVAGIVAPEFDLFIIGKLFFYIAFISFIILFPILMYRVFIIKGFKEEALPTLAIFTAPASVCILAYLKSFDEKNLNMVIFLAILSIILYLAVLINLPKLLKLKFYPSFASFTFPIVISAVAMKKTEIYFNSIEINIVLLKYIVIIQQIIALAMLAYVTYKYIVFMCETK